MPYRNARNGAIRSAAQAFWRVPWRFGVARLLGGSYSLRCVTFHDVSQRESLFTRGMNVSTTPEKFEATLRFLTRYYTPVRLEDVLSSADGRRLPKRAVLVTFDDAYASVVETAAPICRQLGVPAVFFVNGAFVDNQRLATDNLVCYVVNMSGMAAINDAAREVVGRDDCELHSLSDVFSHFLPRISLAEREAFLEALRRPSGINDRRLAGDARLYLTSKMLGQMASFGFEIGNHTYSHAHGRCLAQSDFATEVDRNKATLEALSGMTVRSFSQPYGSSADLSRELERHLERSGHKAIFFCESVANPRNFNPHRLDRISIHGTGDANLFSEIEILPRLRAVRNQLARFGRGAQPPQSQGGLAIGIRTQPTGKN